MPNMPPTFSVIVPTRDRFPKLGACLEALAKQSYPADCYEVIVVNDGSSVSVPSSILAFHQRLDLKILSRPESNGPGVARNVGASQATGQFLAFTDDDCAPEPDWLQQFAIHFADHPDHLVGGRVINALTDNLYSAASHVILDVTYDYYNPRRGRAHFFPTSNLALPMDRFRQLGGFNEQWPLAAAEDREFCYRWLERKWQMEHVPAAKVYHRHQLTFVTFCQLHFRYGRGAYYYHQLRGDEEIKGGLKPDWGFYWNCMRYPFAHFKIGRAAPLTALLLLWQEANAAGYLWQWILRGRQNAS